MPMDSQTLEKAAPLLVLSVQGIFAWALWSLRRAFVRGEDYQRHVEHDALHRQELSGRLGALESRVALLPDGEALAQLAGAVESLRGDIKALDMRITGVDRLLVRLEGVLDRQEMFLRNGGAGQGGGR